MDNNVFSSIINSYSKNNETKAETITPKDKPFDLVDKPNKNIEVPITEYETIKGLPYTAEYFKLDYWPELSGNNKFDVSSIHDNVMKIEKYINSKIVSDGLENNKFSYKTIIDNLKSNIGAKENEMSEHVIKRLSLYIDLLNKQRVLDDKKEKLLYGKLSH